MPEPQLMLRPCALVTGASSGIGRAFVQRLARDGYHLILVARRQERLSELASEVETLGATAEIVVADLTTPEGLAAVEKRAGAGDLTMLVNNAGFQAYRPFVELDPDVAEAQLFLHTTFPSAFAGQRCRRCWSVATGPSSTCPRCWPSARAWISHICRSAPPTPARRRSSAPSPRRSVGELVGTGVKVQALCPAVVRTEFHDVDGKPVLRPNVPVMEPEDVVEASLAGLALGDVICSPALEDRSLIDREREARHAVFGAGRGDALSSRYRDRPAT